MPDFMRVFSIMEPEKPRKTRRFRHVRDRIQEKAAEECPCSRGTGGSPVRCGRAAGSQAFGREGQARRTVPSELDTT
jgi:hypothetical protein